MATQQSAQVYITNTTDGQATITLYHNNSSNGTQNGTWQANPGQQVGPLTVYFETGWGRWGILDYWAVELAVDRWLHAGRLREQRDPPVQRLEGMPAAEP